MGSQGDRIRKLFASAQGNVVVIAPFIKRDALQSLLDVVPGGSAVRCVTRWRSQEVAAGVSDPEIIYLLGARGKSELYLVDNLHAKLYIAGDDCLVGSANVTHSGLGDLEKHNIEILVEAKIHEPAVEATLREITRTKRLATEAMARAVLEMAQVLREGERAKTAPKSREIWFPRSIRAYDAYYSYTSTVAGIVTASDRCVLEDLARGNLQPGLTVEEFRDEVRRLLKGMEIAGMLLDGEEDGTLAFADAKKYLDTLASDEFSAFDLWRAFVAWMVEFFPEQVVTKEIVEVALRRGRLVHRT